MSDGVFSQSYYKKRQKDANDVQQQLSQVENMISGGCNVLVIAAIEGSSFGEALDMAKDAGIPVIECLGRRSIIHL